MPGCAAVGCNNRSEKGYIMKCFPRDPKLRKIWQDRVARADWEPSNNSFLCHVHFEPDEWCVAQNGRIRLRKNAVPSIFTVTSTRKSAKKRIKLTNVKKENECENDYTTESLENDTEYSWIGHLDEKDSDSRDDRVDNNPPVWPLVCQPANQSPRKMENKSSHYIDITSHLQQENVVIISDDNNMKIESNTKENDVFASADNEISVEMFLAKRNSPGNQYGNQNETVESVTVKTEIKLDVDEIFDDGYDEIEEKLKQICDDHREDNPVKSTEKVNSMSRNWKESITQAPFHKSINYKCSPKNEIGEMLIDNRDNIEIIFGSESGEDFARVPRYTFYNNGITNEIDQRIPNVDSITNDKEMDETFPEHLEEAFGAENIHVANTLRTAAKCKRKTREEVMKSIKRSIQDASFGDTNSTSNSDASDIVRVENQVKKELNTSEITRYSNDDAASDAKFIVKVTGDREDVFDIMQDLFKDTKDFTIQEHNNTCLQQENNITSIITIDDYPMETDLTDKYNIDDALSSSIASIASIASKGDDLSTLKNECQTARLLSSDLDMNEDKDLDVNNAIVNSEQSTTNDTNKCEYEKLQQKVKLQETVIRQLTNQLILLKDLEKKLQDKNLLLKARTKKIEKKMNELHGNKNPGGTSSSISYKQTDMRQRLIYNLSNRMNNLEEMNKKLMKTITIECQQKRQLENQVKQRDKQIKELNWKLEKASKYLERAEKNTNTYKRKMLNMQTFIRRKKLLDGNTKFHEIMIDSMKENYSGKVLTMATEIQEICGTNGYKKLLSYGFPLPALSVLQTLPADAILDSSQSNNKIQRATALKQNTNEERDTQLVENDMEVHSKKHAENVTSFCGEITMDDTETVTGTVQDIFDESNDDLGDFSTNELREHFILHLNEVL